MTELIRLYKGTDFLGRFAEAKEVFDFIQDVENVRLKCLCELPKYGYSYKMAIRGEVANTL